MTLNSVASRNAASQPLRPEPAAAGSGREGWLAAFRDATLFKVIYGWGLRRAEAAMLDVSDFSANPAAPQLGDLGMCQVRFGKAKRGSAPRRRAVATVMPWAAEALGQYLEEVRPRYGAGAHPAVWLTERGGRISTSQVDERFRLWRGRAGLPEELSVHCLRHSYVSHLEMRGVAFGASFSGSCDRCAVRVLGFWRSAAAA